MRGGAEGTHGKECQILDASLSSPVSAGMLSCLSGCWSAASVVLQKPGVQPWMPACVTQATPSDGILSLWPQSPFSSITSLSATFATLLEAWKTLRSLVPLVLRETRKLADTLDAISVTWLLLLVEDKDGSGKPAASLGVPGIGLKPVGFPLGPLPWLC